MIVGEIARKNNSYELRSRESFFNNISCDVCDVTTLRACCQFRVLEKPTNVFGAKFEADHIFWFFQRENSGGNMRVIVAECI